MLRGKEEQQGQIAFKNSLILTIALVLVTNKNIPQTFLWDDAATPNQTFMDLGWRQFICGYRLICKS